MSIATAFAEAPTYEDLIARGHALVPDFADRAARCESDCRVSDESVEQFRHTGLHKTLLPAAQARPAREEVEVMMQRTGEPLGR